MTGWPEEPAAWGHGARWIGELGCVPEFEHALEAFDVEEFGIERNLTGVVDALRAVALHEPKSA